MQGVTILAVGGLKERYFTDACAEYQKRLSAFCRLSLIEIEEYRLSRDPAAAEIERGLADEGRHIIAKIPSRAFVIPLCVEGQALSSPQLAAKLVKIAETAPQVAFIIGGSHGLSDEVKSLADFKLSMSAMTFPHQLARVMLLEQVYRAFSIAGNRKYHK